MNKAVTNRWLARVLVSLMITLLFAGLAALPRPGLAQEEPPATTPGPSTGEAPIQAPDQVDVQPLARDEQITQRLQDILDATGWFISPSVRVQNGVVFLSGQTETEEYKRWAGDLARNTQDVAAVVNQIEILEPSIWDFEPAFNGLRDLGRRVVRSLPMLAFSILVLLLAGWIARLFAAATHLTVMRRLHSPLLSNVASRGAGALVFILGLYIVFYMAGLTSAALTLVGGTGLLGIILGIAFRDISENFLASIFLSFQNPFKSGDLVEIEGIKGYVQSLTTRATVLMMLNGNHVQIPNSTVYKSKIRNYTSNPNVREDFAVGIGYDENIQETQDLALKILNEHPAVLKDPEPMVLVESLGSATVNLRLYFWIDTKEHSALKVKSSIIRLVKRAFQAAEISMPGEVRELIIPEGVSVRMDGQEGKELAAEDQRRRSKSAEALTRPAEVSTEAEGGLSSEAEEIQEQARQARIPEEGENLLLDGDDQEETGVEQDRKQEQW